MDLKQREEAASQLVASVKEAIDRITGDSKLRAEGRAGNLGETPPFLPRLDRLTD